VVRSEPLLFYGDPATVLDLRSAVTTPVVPLSAVTTPVVPLSACFVTSCNERTVEDPAMNYGENYGKVR